MDRYNAVWHMFDRRMRRGQLLQGLVVLVLLRCLWRLSAYPQPRIDCEGS